MRAVRLAVVAPKIVLEPGEWLVLHRWWLTESTNAPTFEFELGVAER